MEILLIHLEAQRSILDGYCNGLNNAIKKLDDRLTKQELNAKKKVVKFEEKEVEIVKEIDQLIAKAEKLFQPECQKLVCPTETFENILSKKLYISQGTEPLANVKLSLKNNKDVNDRKKVHSTKLKTTQQKKLMTINKPKISNNLLLSNNNVSSASAKGILGNCGQHYIKQSKPIKVAGVYEGCVKGGDRGSLPQEPGKSKTFLQDNMKESKRIKDDIQKDSLAINRCNADNDEISEKLFDEEFLISYKKYLSLEKVIGKLKCSPVLLRERKNTVDEFMSSLENSRTEKNLIGYAFHQDKEYHVTLAQQIIDEKNEATDQHGHLDQNEVMREVNTMIRIEQLAFKKYFSDFTRKMADKCFMNVKGTDRQSSKIYKQLYYLLVDSYPTLIFSG